METPNKNNRLNRHIAAGTFIMVIGIIWLLENIGLDIPDWVLSWSSIMVAIGLWIGFRKDFKAGGWMILVMIGGIYTLRDIAIFDISRITGALVLIGLGVYLVLKPAKKSSLWDCDDKKTINFDNQ